MWIPRPRFTVRLLMIAVAIAGGLIEFLSMWSRSVAYHQRYIDHEKSKRAYDLTPVIYSHDGVISILYPPPLSARDEEAWKRKFDHHRRLAEKYERAARYPWLTVEPDPPELSHP
jgi:hypothetical protein